MCARALARARLIAPSLPCCRSGAWPRVRQVIKNPELTSLDLPKLKAISMSLYVRARPRSRSADRARAVARIAPSLPCY